MKKKQDTYRKNNRNLSLSERAAQLAAVDNEMENEKSKTLSLSDYLPQSEVSDTELRNLIHQRCQMYMIAIINNLE